MGRRRELTNDAAKTTSWVSTCDEGPSDPQQLVRGLIPLWSVYADKDDLADDPWPKEHKRDQLLILLGVKVNISPAPTCPSTRPVAQGRLSWTSEAPCCLNVS